MEKSISKFLAVAAVAILGGATCLTASASTVVTFDNANGNSSTSYTESGFTLTNSGISGSNGIAYWSGTGNNTPNYAFCSNDSGCGGYNTTFITVTSAGGAFSLTSFDGNNYNSGLSGTFTLVGALVGGGSVTDTFAYGTAWQHYSVNNFSDVTSVTFSSTGGNWGAAIDNLTFNAPASVPEPESLALFGLGLAGLCVMRRKAKLA